MSTQSVSFTDVGDGAALFVRNGTRYTYDVSGTFVGTCIVERSLNGGATWEPIQTFTGAAAGTLSMDTPAQSPALVRFRCSAYTSGTIVTVLENVASVASVDGGSGVFRDAAGNIVAIVKSDGVHTIGSFVEDAPLS